MKKHRLAVLGNPVSHSRSPQIHVAFAQQLGIDLSYEKIEVPAGEFNQVASGLLSSHYSGFNVTLPCKGDAFRFASRCSSSALRSEAVNTISITDEMQIHGDNTDGPGLVKDLTENLGWQIENQRILVLGAGGAVRGILWDLLQASPQMVHLYNRTAAKAEAIVKKMADPSLITVTKASLEQGYDMVINGTSAGLGGEVPDLPASVLRRDSHSYDMVYGPGTTAFNDWCHRTSGCEVADGLGMLVEQAALSFQIWFSRKVQTAQVIAILRNSH
jgi:shikimate dehydrogenase